MASPAVSTPSSAGSPPAIAPAPPTLAIKTVNVSNMTALSPASGLATPSMITRKEWIIPPRPKPGRKPATDTPPTKRKAQNRAAQRAFRERRAARVGELEEQLEETKEEQQKREGDMRNKIVRLEADLERFTGELQSWKVRCDTLDRIAEYERREKEAALAELSYLRNGSRNTGTDAVPLPPRRNRQNVQKGPEPQRYASPALDIESTPIGCGGCTSSSNCACVDEAMAIAASGCGKCSVDTHCECLEETLNPGTEASSSADLKRAHSPSAEEQAEKRRRQSAPSTPLEVDFTAQFSSKPVARQPIHESHIQVSRPPVESCGFCEEGTYCVCAEEAAANASNEQNHENRLAPLLNEVTPPPSDTDVEGSMLKLPSMQPNHMHRPVATQAQSNSCANGPGTCQQCQLDPKSASFCRSLAAMHGSTTPNSTPPGGCCGGNTAGGGCCKSLPAAATSHPPPSLSVADTYKTLSTHKGFEQASDELSTWLGRLHATPPRHEGREPIEVEAASVMGVLKLFDRRFGRG
ncbi:AP-1-like transcription factor napA [Lachnellula arida]|uniref:AP-1-like transcription factor napA n=1 Tax=Lachnellula arida TaxID=1316785 RepID=A0A8T9BCA3_9HELO|nr:AP-1-like transcription factor napA [Lachnellula arida]